MTVRLCVCGAAIEEHGKREPCPRCGIGKTKPRRSPKEAGYDQRWRELSERYRAEVPLCEECCKKGMATPAEEVHHIVPVCDAPWLRLVRSNLMSVCVPCHRKMDAERRRANAN